MSILKHMSFVSVAFLRIELVVRYSEFIIVLILVAVLLLVPAVHTYSNLIAFLWTCYNVCFLSSR